MPKVAQFDPSGEASATYAVELHDPRCVYAREFLVWCETNILAPLQETPNRTAVYKAMLELQKRYFAWYFQVPKKHREHASTRGHICIFHIYMQVLAILMRLEVNLSEALLFMPTNAPASSLPDQFKHTMGIPVGIDIELLEKMIKAGETDG